MAETLTYGAVSGHVGTAAMVLGWFAVGLIGVATIGLLIMIMSISLLRKFSDGSDATYSEYIHSDED